MRALFPSLFPPSFSREPLLGEKERSSCFSSVFSCFQKESEEEELQEVDYTKLSLTLARNGELLPDEAIGRLEEGRLYFPSAMVYSYPATAAFAFSTSHESLSREFFEKLAALPQGEALFIPPLGEKVDREGLFSLEGGKIVGVRFFAYKWELFFPQGDKTEKSPFLLRAVNPSFQ